MVFVSSHSSVDSVYDANRVTIPTRFRDIFVMTSPRSIVKSENANIHYGLENEKWGIQFSGLF